MINYTKSKIGVYYFFVFTLIIGIVSCGKGVGNNQTPAEEPIVFSISPDPTSAIFPAIGTSQDFAFSITSKMPTSGFKIELVLTKDIDGSSVFSQSLTSSIPNLTISYQNLSSGIVCSGIIKVTSLTTLTNSSSKTFKIAKK